MTMNREEQEVVLGSSSQVGQGNGEKTALLLIEGGFFGRIVYKSQKGH